MKDFCELEQKKRKCNFIFKIEAYMGIRKNIWNKTGRNMQWKNKSFSNGLAACGSDAVPKTVKQANLCAEICPSRRVGAILISDINNLDCL